MIQFSEAEVAANKYSCSKILQGTFMIGVY